MNVSLGKTSAREELALSWRQLLGAFLGVAAGITALPYYTQGIFVPSLTTEFGWSREQMSLVTFAGGVVLACTSPLVGMLIDRVGVRGPLACSFAAMVFGYLALSMTNSSFMQFFLLQIMLFIAGSATGPVTFTRVINQRFKTMRGLALGVTLAGTGAMAVVAPPFVAEVLQNAGWRAAYQSLAVIMIATAALSLLLLWQSTGRLQLHVPRHPTQVIADGPGINRLLFWRLFITFVFLALGIGGFAFHMVPLLTDAGVPLTRAAEIQSLIGLSVLVGRLASGFLIDRFFAPTIAALVMVLAALGVAGLATLGPAAAPICALLIGFALGTEGDVIGYLTARYFGLKDYGRLFGALYGVFALGLGLSPVLISSLHEASGSYQAALWISFGLLTFGAVSVFTLPKFRSNE